MANNCSICSRQRAVLFITLTLYHSTYIVLLIIATIYCELKNMTKINFLQKYEILYEHRLLTRTDTSVYCTKMTERKSEVWITTSCEVVREL